MAKAARMWKKTLMAKRKPAPGRKTKTVKKTKAPAKKKREGKPHAYWPRSSERQLVSGLGEELQDAYAKLKTTLAELGAQYVYASAKAIMFARQRCYAFVRPKKKYLEITFFLGESLRDERLKRVDTVSARKFAHILHVTHADQIEEPVTDWLARAYEEAPPGIPPNFRGQGGGDQVEIIEEGAGARGWARPIDAFDVADLDPDDFER